MDKTECGADHDGKCELNRVAIFVITMPMFGEMVGRIGARIGAEINYGSAMAIRGLRCAHSAQSDHFITS